MECLADLARSFFWIYWVHCTCRLQTSKERGLDWKQRAPNFGRACVGTLTWRNSVKEMLWSKKRVAKLSNRSRPKFLSTSNCGLSNGWAISAWAHDDLFPAFKAVEAYLPTAVSFLKNTPSGQIHIVPSWFSLFCTLLAQSGNSLHSGNWSAKILWGWRNLRCWSQWTALLGRDKRLVER